MSGGAVGSPQLLLLSGIGPRAELEAVGVTCAVDAPDVGKHLKDHLQVGLFFPAPGVGVSMTEVGDIDGARRAACPRRTAAGRPGRRPVAAAGAPGAQGRSRAPRHRVGDHRPRPGVVVALRRVGVRVHRPRRRAHPRRSDRPCSSPATTADIWQRCLRVDPDDYFEDADAALAADAESIFVLANPVQPHSEGEIQLASADPLGHPDIRMNYYDDPHDIDVMVAVMRRALDIAEHWPATARSPGDTDDHRGAPRLPARRPPERRPARGHGPPLLVHRLPPDQHVSYRQRGRPAATGQWRARPRGWPTRA